MDWIELWWFQPSLPSGNLLEKLERCGFFDDDITTSIIFLTVHDAVLHIFIKKNLHSIYKYRESKEEIKETKFDAMKTPRKDSKANDYSVAIGSQL